MSRTRLGIGGLSTWSARLISVGALVVAVAATPVPSRGAEPKPPQPLSSSGGCCVCRIAQPGGGYASSSCTDVAGYSSCRDVCSAQSAKTVVFSAQATCASGCRGLVGGR